MECELENGMALPLSKQGRVERAVPRQCGVSRNEKLFSLGLRWLA
jgi:hypothetical protein